MAAFLLRFRRLSAVLFWLLRFTPLTSELRQALGQKDATSYLFDSIENFVKHAASTVVAGRRAAPTCAAEAVTRIVGVNGCVLPERTVAFTVFWQCSCVLLQKALAHPNSPPLEKGFKAPS